MKVKICGITRLEDARYCAGAGADYLGFIQHPESPRYVDPTLAQEIIEWVYGPETVGVFVDAPSDLVNRTADRSGFSMVQLHGDEPPEYCAEIERPVIKSFRVFPDTTAGDLLRAMEPFADHAEQFLLDTGKTGVPGGTGTAFDWSLAARVAAEYEVVLAGGLSAQNVAEAVALVRPYAVDVASGVESAPGVKDIDRISDFFDAVRAARG